MFVENGENHLQAVACYGQITMNGKLLLRNFFQYKQS